MHGPRWRTSICAQGMVLRKKRACWSAALTERVRRILRGVGVFCAPHATLVVLTCIPRHQLSLDALAAFRSLPDNLRDSPPPCLSGRGEAVSGDCWRRRYYRHPTADATTGQHFLGSGAPVWRKCGGGDVTPLVLVADESRAVQSPSGNPSPVQQRRCQRGLSEEQYLSARLANTLRHPGIVSWMAAFFGEMDTLALARV